MKVSNAQLHQTMASQFEDAMNFPKTQQQQEEEEQQQQQQEKKPKPRPSPEQALQCPRCDSSNTKFCYYNNYSLTQPRYFCKGCRRYWTQGGSLRNVPVGGGCRRNRRVSGSSSQSSSKTFDQDFTNINPNPFLPALLPLPPLSYDPNELSFTFATLHNPNPNPSQGLADLDNNNNNGLYYYNGFGNVGEGVLMMNSTEAVTTTGTAAAASQGCVDGEEDSKLMMGSVLHNQWPVHGGGDDHHDSLMMATDPVLRDYWKNGGAGSASLHGLINSSLY